MDEFLIRNATIAAFGKQGEIKALNLEKDDPNVDYCI